MVTRSVVAGFLIVGCGLDRRVEDQTEDGDASAALDDEGAGSGDTGSSPQPEPGASTGVRPGPDSPYPYCEWNGGDYKPYCPPSDGAWGYITWFVDGDAASYCDGGNCNTCICTATCGTAEAPDASLCPTPTSGTAVPECLSPQAMCFLTCDAGQICPDGMQCVLEPEIARRVCAWVVP